MEYTNRIISILLFLLLTQGSLQQQPYRELSYDEILGRLYQLSNQYPNLITVESVHSKYGVPHQYGNCGNSRCLIIMANLTDTQFHNEFKPQVYISGTVHGNERLGANVVTYLIEYLLENYGSDPFVTQLLREREIIITPFVNAQGYFTNTREELTDAGVYMDINRDFPYNRENGDNTCLSTIGARATLQIFRNNLIVGALSFHAGMQTIGYPWGSYNHISRSYSETGRATETPDDTMFSRVADTLYEQLHSDRLSDYDVGEMTDLIYPCYGSLDDWAYASGWDTSPNSRAEYCNPSTYQPYNHNDYFTNVDHIRSSLYIIEASDNKDPPTEEYGTRGDLFCQDCWTEGYITRLMRVSLAYIDSVQPYSVISYPSYMSENQVVRINWKLNGCLTINEMNLDYLYSDQRDFVTNEILNGNVGYCNWEGQQTHFQFDIPVNYSPNSETEILFRIRFKADQDFGDQNSPDPNVNPETYVNNLRLIENYTEEINGKKISNIPRLYSIILAPTDQGTRISFYEVHEESEEYLNQSSS